MQDKQDRLISPRLKDGFGKVTVKCLGCGHSFQAYLCKIKIGWEKYCSRKCSSKALRGRIPWNKGIPRTEEEKLKMRLSQLGKKASIKTRLKMSKMWKGEKSHYWKGGISLNRDRTRGGVLNQIWREKVFGRDNYMCTLCGNKTSLKNKVWMIAHHIESYNSCCKKRYWKSNGITLCNLCHESFHKIYGKGNNNRKQLIQFKKIKLI